jgi:hypothetical protein
MNYQPSLSLLLTSDFFLQDKKINFLSLETGKSLKSIKPAGELGEPIKVRYLCEKCLNLNCNYLLFLGDISTESESRFH